MRGARKKTARQENFCAGTFFLGQTIVLAELEKLVGTTDMGELEGEEAISDAFSASKRPLPPRIG